MSFFSEVSTARAALVNASSRRMSCRRRRPAAKSRRSRRGGRRPWSESKEVLKRLEALKELIPSIAKRNGENAAEEPLPLTADQLFEEAADYILRLRTQVEILKHLVCFYVPAEGN